MNLCELGDRQSNRNRPDRGGLLITSIGDEDTYLAVLERIISECSTVREIMEETSNKLQDEMLLG